MAEKRFYEEPRFEVVEVKASGNTGLPFGLCKKYGIETGKDWTPRDAWNALKNKLGVDPEDVYKELEKDKVETRQADNEVKIKNCIDSKAFKTLSPDMKGKVEKELRNLSPDKLSVIEKYIDKLNSFNHTSGTAYYQFSGDIFFNERSEGTLLDKKLGYDFNACSFFHEYGHFIDNKKARENGGLIMSYDSKNVNVNDDALNAFNMIIAEGGGTHKIQDFTKLTRETLNDFYTGLAKVTGKDQEKSYKRRVDFGYVVEPIKPALTPERAKEDYGEGVYQRTVEQWDQYNKDYKKWQQAEQDGTNAKAEEEYQKNIKEVDEHNKIVYTKIQGYSLLTDFFGLYTNNRVDPLKAGYSGHRGSYNKRHSVQSEMWAEYFSYKMTNNVEGLNLTKRFFPKTYNTFEDTFNKLSKGE